MTERIDCLSALVPLLRRGLVNSGDVEEMLTLLGQLVGASSIALLEDHGFEQSSIEVNVPAQWKNDHSRLAAEDPSRKVLDACPHGSWWVASRDLTYLQQNEELARCFYSAGFVDATIGRIFTPLGKEITLAAYSSSGKFASEAGTMLTLVYPLVAGAIGTRATMEIQGARYSPPPGIVEVSFPDGTVEANRTARLLIERFTGSLSAISWNRAMKAIATAGRRFCNPEQGGRSQTLWPGLRVAFAIGPPRKNEFVRLVGFLEPSGESRSAPVPALVEGLLSRRQLEVARDYANGASIASIARIRHLTAGTVRTHLSAACAKLGVQGRSELSSALRG